jgi:hypothetical protein
LAQLQGYVREKIIPYITEELEVEEFRILPWPSPNYKDLFADIKFKKAQCPIRRSKWGLSLDQYIDKEDIIKYCKCFFLTPSVERTEKFIGGMRHNPTINLSEFEEKCLRRSHIFKQICHGINEKHFPDALHLWTAEENGLDVFLTTDKKFKNVMARQRVDLKCIVMFPSELINVINGGAALGNPRADA